MAEMKRKLRRVMSLVLVFAMVFTMGTPVQAQTSIAALSKNVQAVVDQTDEVTEKEADQTEDADNSQKQEDSAEVEKPQKQEESVEEEKSTKQEESETAESTQKQEEWNEAESTQKQEEITESESTKEQEETTEAESTKEQEETTEAGSTEEEETTETESTEEEEETTETESIERQEDESDSLEPLKFDKTRKYAIVAQSTGKAMNTEKIGWQTHTKVGAVYYKNGQKLLDEQALFIVTPGDSAEIASDDIKAGDGEVKVRIECPIEGTRYPLRTETGNNYSFVDEDKRYDKKQEIYIIKTTGKNQGTIRVASNNWYATIEDGELRFSDKTTEEKAEKFEFVKDPTIISDMSVSFEHKLSGDYIKTYSGNDVPLTVDGNKGDSDTIFSKVWFGTCDNTKSGNVLATVGLTSQAYENDIQSVIWHDFADAAKVLTENEKKKKGNGWESIRIVGNGDGTVSFKDSYYDEYITVDSEKNLAGRFKEELTDNEKFSDRFFQQTAETEENIKAVNDVCYSYNSKDCRWGIRLIENGELLSEIVKRYARPEIFALVDADPDFGMPIHYDSYISMFLLVEIILLEFECQI